MAEGRSDVPVRLLVVSAIDELQLPESRWVDIGGPVCYREWDGPADGPTFVCAHGLGGSLLNWAVVAPGLAERGRVLALDLPGFGLTPLEGRSAGVSANWRLLNGFLRALDLPPIVLVGNSMGGMLTLIQSAHHPESLSQMILVDAAFPRGRGRAAQPSPWLAGAFAVYSTSRLGEKVMAARARRLGAEGLVRETLRLCAADPSRIDPKLVAAHVEMTRRREAFDYAAPAFQEAARSIFLAQVRPARYRAVVRRARTPALVIHGGRDRLVPVGIAREAARDHDNWTLEVFHDLGHIPQMEAPERWLATVNQWLDHVGEVSRASDRVERPTG
jgi:pimeloyl-ACP methyl ester carboxylesterase